MAPTSWPLALVLLLPCVTALSLSAQPCTRTLRRIPRSTASCKLNEIGETSQTTRSLVSSLTALVNAISGSAPPPAPRERAQASLDGAELLEGLRADFEENEYLWSGKITTELYDEDCVFTDPTLSFTGLATFERNLANLDPWIERFVPPGRRSCELKKIELLDARGMFSVAKVVRQLGCPSRLGRKATAPGLFVPGRGASAAQPSVAADRSGSVHARARVVPPPARAGTPLSPRPQWRVVAHRAPLNTQDGSAIVAEWRMVGDLAQPAC